MNKEQWDLLPDFSRDENWGDPDKMDFVLLWELQKLRTLLGTEIFISRGYEARPNAASQHNFGKAVDVLFPGNNKSIFEIFLLAERFSFSGIGIYPAWTGPKRSKGGLHLDTRNDKPARWMGHKTIDPVTKIEKTIYVPLDYYHLKQLGAF